MLITPPHSRPPTRGLQLPGIPNPDPIPIPFPIPILTLACRTIPTLPYRILPYHSFPFSIPSPQRAAW